jgi:hypothetical protein
MADPPRFDPDLEWLDLVRPIGLVVAPSLLKELGLSPELQTRTDNAAVGELLSPEDEEGPALPDPWSFAERVLGWPSAHVAGARGGPTLPDDLCKVLPEYDTVLEPHWAVAGLDAGWQLLVRIEGPGIGPDARGALAGWEATPHQRFERLLRETGIPIGVLISDKELRLVYAPRGETSGWIAFPLRPLATVAGRPMLGGLKLMLGSFRLFNDAEDRRLPALLKTSREAQAAVSTALAEQVVGALHELLRGLAAAEPELICNLATERPQHLYEGLLTVLMRLVFVLYAEDRDLIPSRIDAQARAFYDQGYSARGLHGKLLEDQARHPDTMEERLGAWGRLIALFRLVYAGDRTGWIRARGGKLFDPDAFPFLEGRAIPEEAPHIAQVTDGCVLRILDGLLTLKGERLSYRTLDVEQVGSVYETVMGFTVLRATGPALAIRAGRHNRTPVFVDLAELAALKPDERLTRLKEGAQRSGQLAPRQQQAIKAAAGEDGMAAALDGIVDERGSPDKRVMPAGTPILQPTDERRRTGSHYTPRSLTEPIVRYALEPAFERLGPNATPEEVLDLKVCDPAMGSGAFLVEACRALAARLVQAWARWPETRPKLPPDEDEDLHARRLVAQRCLYGVDKNPMATDLAKLSLWLATLARDHEFTFLDHALMTGDSLVGLTRAQIAAVHWDTNKPGLPLFRALIRDRFEAALAGRAEIRDAHDDVERSIQEVRYQHIKRRLSDVRLLGDAVIAAFFMADKAKAREEKRQEIESWLNGPVEAMWIKVGGLASTLRQGERPVPPFHWELEFPEVFARESFGFDAMVGNPPFLGGKRISSKFGIAYRDWLSLTHLGASQNVDLVGHFFRAGFNLIQSGGALGLLATNTISQGDTREGSLGAIIARGGSIFRAERQLSWPGEAEVIVSMLHIVRGVVTNVNLDGKPVVYINSNMTSGTDLSKALSLPENLGQSLIGVQKNGPFDIPGEMARSWLLAPPNPNGRSNLEVLSPYRNGDDITGRSRDIWLIDFPLELTETEASGFKGPFEYLRNARYSPERGAPEISLVLYRLNTPGQNKAWWQPHRPRPEMRRQIRKLGRYIVTPGTPTHTVFAWLPAEVVPDNNLIVITRDDDTTFGILQSRFHLLWVRELGSPYGNHPTARRYNSSRVFLTFPFPDGLAPNILAETYATDPRAALIASAARQLNELREAWLNPSDLVKHVPEDVPGYPERIVPASPQSATILKTRTLTNLYNARPGWLGTAHSELDAAVAAAYGWKVDISDDEVLARLLALNAERAAAERAAGVAVRRRIKAKAAELEEI